MGSLERLAENWEALATEDPMFAILGEPGKRGNRWDREEFLASGVDDVREAMAALAALGLEVDKTRALDFGCGLGRLTQALAETFDEIEGVDISPRMIELAESMNRNPGRCRFSINHRADLSRFEDGAFSLVLSSLVLQHTGPALAGAYIGEFVRVLKPAGVAVFDIPDLRGSAAARVAFVGIEAARRRAAVRTRLHWLAARARGAAGSPRPGRMEMHAISERRVRELVATAGGITVDVRLAASAGPSFPPALARLERLAGYQGKRYVIRKPG